MAALRLPLIDQALQLADQRVSLVSVTAPKSNLLDVSVIGLDLWRVNPTLALDEAGIVGFSGRSIGVISDEKLRLIGRARCDSAQLIPTDSVQDSVRLIEQTALQSLLCSYLQEALGRGKEPFFLYEIVRLFEWKQRSHLFDSIFG